MRKQIIELWSFVKFCLGGQRKYRAKLAELEAAKKSLMFERQMLLAEVFRQVPSMNPRRKPELRN